MFNKKKKNQQSSQEYSERLSELLNDPTRQAKSEEQRENLERLLNTPMRWYHKLPYWVIIGLIIYGLGKLLGFV